VPISNSPTSSRIPPTTISNSAELGATHSEGIGEGPRALLVARTGSRLARRRPPAACGQNDNRVDQKHQVKVGQEVTHRKKSKTAVVQESTNFYATNFRLGSIPPLFIHQIGRSRWLIDTQVFQTLTADCHLKHPTAHQNTAIVVLTMIRLLAYTLSLVFFRRQVCSLPAEIRGRFSSSPSAWPADSSRSQLTLLDSVLAGTIQIPPLPARRSWTPPPSISPAARKLAAANPRRGPVLSPIGPFP